MIYLIGSLRNPEVPILGNKLRDLGLDVFDDWYAVGPEADEYWRTYEMGRGHNFQEALDGRAAKHIFEWDKTHLDQASIGILILPAGKSGHLEMGYLAGRGARTYILLDEKAPERFDVMYQFATKVCATQEELIDELRP